MVHSRVVPKAWEHYGHLPSEAQAWSGSVLSYKIICKGQESHSNTGQWNKVLENVRKNTAKLNQSQSDLIEISKWFRQLWNKVKKRDLATKEKALWTDAEATVIRATWNSHWGGQVGKGTKPGSQIHPRVHTHTHTRGHMPRVPQTHRDTETCTYTLHARTHTRTYTYTTHEHAHSQPYIPHAPQTHTRA